MNLPESKTVIVEHSNKKVYDLGDKIAKVFNSPASPSPASAPRRPSRSPRSPVRVGACSPRRSRV